MWRCTADIIYLIENPVIREAFFPSESAMYSIEPGMPTDRDTIMSLAKTHEPAAAVEALQLWWKHLPSAFHVVKDASGTIVGCYCMAKPDELDNEWMRFDPVAAELGIVEDRLLDPAARELLLNGNRIPLTPLEYGVVSMLESRAGDAVSRGDLLRQVWGHGHNSGSNVVDAVVRGLRRKCGDQANIFETVRGVGYRLRT